MALSTALLPQYVLQDGRYETSAYDTNGNLVAWPNTKNGPYDLNQKTGLNVQSTTITNADALTGDVVVFEYNSVKWFLTANVAATIPKVLRDLATIGGSPYTVT